jgi:type IV secretory pathway TrbD component
MVEQPKRQLIRGPAPESFGLPTKLPKDEARQPIEMRQMDLKHLCEDVEGVRLPRVTVPTLASLAGGIAVAAGFAAANEAESRANLRDGVQAATGAQRTLLASEVAHASSHLIFYITVLVAALIVAAILGCVAVVWRQDADMSLGKVKARMREYRSHYEPDAPLPEVPRRPNAFVWVLRSLVPYRRPDK